MTPQTSRTVPHESSWGGSQSLLGKRNTSLTLKTIYDRGPVSKRELAGHTGLSVAKINSLVSTLIRTGIVYESGKQQSIGGRRSSLYELNTEFKYSVGCQLSHTQIHTIVSNLKGKIIAETLRPYHKSDGKELVIDLIIKSIRDVMTDSGLPKEQFLGIGLAIAGLVNPIDGTTMPFPHLVKWGNVPFENTLMSEFALPCHVINVANAAMLAEHKIGVAKGYDNSLFLNVGTGLGMGILFNGKLYEGTTGTAGEFGHITVDENGPLCECGNIGCLEAIASTNAVITKGQQVLKQGVFSTLSETVHDDFNKLTFEDICHAAEKGDKLAFDLIHKMGEDLGEGIVTLINLINPQMIVLGGRVVKAKNSITSTIMNTVLRRALAIPRRHVQIVFSLLEGSAGTIGSTIPIIERFLEDPFEERLIRSR
ncbi:MAG: ROK family transcriptional regulator [Bacteroidota bacterium]